jgi:hypothetical protein
MKNRLIIIGADFSANALVGQIETSYSLRVDVESVEVSRTTPATIYATSELQTFNDDVYVGSTPVPISVSATGGLIATVGAPEGNVYPITLDASAVSQEQCEITITQIGTSNSATVVANAQIYAIKRSTNAPLMDVVYAQGWSASPDYMTFDEAAAVTTFGTTFKGNTEITNGEDFQYFTGLTTWAGAWQNMTALTKIKAAGRPTTGRDAFNGCTSLVEIDITNADMSVCINCDGMFGSFAGETLDISSWATDKITDGTRPFDGVNNLKHLILSDQGWGGVLYGLMQYTSMASMVKVDGWFNFKGVKSFDYMLQYTVATWRKIEFRYAGTVSNLTTMNCKGLTNWGINSAEVPDARQSLKNTFDYLFDRASAGYESCTITLSTNTLNELIDIFGDDGMLAIINKGYTIANYTPIYPPDYVYDNIASLDGAVMFYNSGAEALLAKEEHTSVLGVAPKIDFIGCIADDAGVVSAVYDMGGASYSVTNVSVVGGKLRPTDSTTFGKITLNRTKECSALYYEGTPLLGSGKQQVFINNILQSYTGISAIFYQGGKTNIQVNQTSADVKGVTTDTINQLLVKVSGGTTADISLVEVNGNNVTAQLGAGADFWGSQKETPFITIGNDFETFYAG